MFEIRFTKNALEGVSRLEKSEPAAFRKLCGLIEELREHPFSGTGKPEQLKGFKVIVWSRKITQKHRLVYEIENDTVRVILLSVYGHYGDK